MVLNKRVAVASILFMAMVFTPCTVSATLLKDQISSDDVLFSIKGNSGRFQIDVKKGRIELADCIVTSVRAYKTTWEIPEEYKNEQTIQRIFDEIIAGEMVQLSEEQIKSMYEGELDYYTYAGIGIDFESPKGASQPPVYQKAGQGYGMMFLKPMDAQAHAFLENLVEITLLVYTNKGQTARNFQLRSAALADIVTEMSAQDHTLKDLADAQSVEAYDCWASMEFAMPAEDEGPGKVTEDAQAIARLTEVLQTGERLDCHVKVYPRLLLRFNMPDGRTLAAYVAEPQKDSAYDHTTARWEGYTFVMAGDALYSIDVEPLDDALISAGLWNGMEADE